MADRNIGTLSYKITGDTRPLDKSLKNSDKEVKGFGKSLGGLGKLITGAAVGGALIFGAKKIAELGKASILAASEAEETANKFAVVFRDISVEAQEAAENLSDNFGLSNQAAQDLLAGTGDLLTGFGFTQDSALDLSDQVNQLAVDLASFTNFSGGAEGASEALTKALLGERESVKALGISILDADVKAKVLELTQQGLTFETERQAKAIATLSIAQEQSQNALGDFSRSSASFANQQRIAAAAVDDLSTALGKNLLPAATEVVSIFGELTGELAGLIEQAQAVNDTLKDLEDGSLDTDVALETLHDTLAKLNAQKAAGSAVAFNANIEDEIAAVQALIDAYGIEEQFLIRAADAARVLAQVNADAATKQAAELELQAAANERLEELRQEGLSSNEKQIELLQAQIEHWAEFRDIADVQELLNALVAERDELLAEENESLDEVLDTEEAVFDERLAMARSFAQERQAIEMEQAEELRRIQEEQSAFEAQTLLLRAQGYAGFFGAISGLISAFGVQSREQAIAIKAFSSAEAGINSYLAFTQVLADPSFIGRPIARGVSAAAALTAGLAQQVKILATPIPAFADGGIVPGSSFTGDNVLARVNSGEEVLTRDDPRHALNNGGGQTINVMLDRKVLVRAVVDGVNAGQGGVLDARVVK